MIREMRERFSGIEARLTDRELHILDLIKYLSNDQSTARRNETISNLKMKKGTHIVGSTYITNQKVNNSIPDLELREISNLVEKLEMWKVMYIPKFGIPFFSAAIYGKDAPENEWLFFGNVYEATFKEIKKYSFSFKDYLISRA